MGFIEKGEGEGETDSRCVIIGSCVDFTSISLCFKKCVIVYKESECKEEEMRFSYDDVYGNDTSRDCVVNYNNGILSD